jgi:hypothetical protein
VFEFFLGVERKKKTVRKENFEGEKSRERGNIFPAGEPLSEESSARARSGGGQRRK